MPSKAFSLKSTIMCKKCIEILGYPSFSMKVPEKVLPTLLCALFFNLGGRNKGYHHFSNPSSKCIYLSIHLIPFNDLNQYN